MTRKSEGQRCRALPAGDWGNKGEFVAGLERVIEIDVGHVDGDGEAFAQVGQAGVLLFENVERFDDGGVFTQFECGAGLAETFGDHREKKHVDLHGEGLCHWRGH